MAQRRALVVDDEPEIVDLLRDILEGRGFEVDSAPDARTALELIRENIYDVAVLDFNLPDMNGIMLHRQIRQMDAELAARTIFMSGYVQAEQHADYYSAHGGPFLSKPFEVDEVLRAVDALLES